jgi:hypothetical protein
MAGDVTVHEQYRRNERFLVLVQIPGSGEMQQ